jgi:hypothetical protein
LSASQNPEHGCNQILHLIIRQLRRNRQTHRLPSDPQRMRIIFLLALTYSTNTSSKKHDCSGYPAIPGAV